MNCRKRLATRTWFMIGYVRILDIGDIAGDNRDPAASASRSHAHVIPMNRSAFGLRPAIGVLAGLLLAVLAIAWWPRASEGPSAPPEATRAGGDDQEPGPTTAETESFHDAASAQLARIGKLIVAAEKVEPARLVDLVTDAFTCGPLVPDEMRVAHEDAAIHVARGDVDASRVHRGAAGLADALNRCIEDLEGVANIRYKFKQFRVEPGADASGTTDYFSLGGLRDGGAVEQHATWRCVWDIRTADERPRLVSLAVSDFERTTVTSPSRTLFADCTEAVLVGNPAWLEQLCRGARHWVERIERRQGIDFNGHHGLALGDADGDGLDDLYLCQGGGLPNRLFIRKPDGTLVDRSAPAGVDLLDPTTSSLFIDVDNDGDQDLVVATRRALLVMENDGKGRFDIRFSSRKAADAMSVTAADYDDDGDLDLHACRYYPLADVRQSPVALPYHDANNGPPNTMLRNEGDWRFTDVTAAAGLDANNRRWSYAAAWEDFDDDGDADLYVANDFGRNCLYRNDGSAGFVDVAAEAGVEDIASGMSVTWGDYDGDGLMDVYVSNMFSSAGGRIAYQRSFKPGTTAEVMTLIRRLARGNSLFKNLGDGTFRDVSLETGTTMGRWAWSSNFFDMNNDGWEDLLVANGHITGEDTGDL